MLAADTRRAVTRAEVVLAFVGLGLLAAAWYLLTLSLGAVGIARNDDWSYIENAFRFADSGIFAVGGWVQMMLIGQLVLAWPIVSIAGPSIAALQALVTALGALLLLSSYLVLRNFLNRAWAAIGTAVVALSALFGLLSVSFMTDVPAAAFQVLAIAIAYRALRTARIDWPILLIATLMGFVAFSIREYAVVALAAIWITLLRASRVQRSYRGLLIWTLGVVLLVSTFLVWRSGQVTVTDSPLGLNPVGLRYLAWWPLTAGWLLLPVLIGANPVRLASRAWADSRVLTMAAVAAVTVALAHTRLGFLGNYLSLTGGYAEVLRGLPTPVLPTWWSFAVTMASVYGAYVLALVIVTAVCSAWRGRQELMDRPLSNTTLAVSFVWITVIIYAFAPVVANVALFDRYFLPVLPVAAGLVIWWLARTRLFWRAPHLPVIVVLVASTLTNVVLVSATSARDAARWQMASQAAGQLGVAEGNIDGGFDYFTFNTDGGPRPEGVRWTWWTAQLGDRAVCATVTYADPGLTDEAAGPDPDLRPFFERTVSVPLARDQLLVVYPGPDSC